LSVAFRGEAACRGAEPPDFPAELRRSQPVDDIGQAVVYTINESIQSEYDLMLARKVGSDVLVRGWFKWRDAADYRRLAPLAARARGLGALFGGGITCSALYEGENGLDQARVSDMATRGPDGRLVNAWNEPGCRHGTLSNPAYREYLLSWCRRQIDAGVDYLFMDEINAALEPDEGFDDYSLADFRAFLVRRFVEGRGWKPDDPRWSAEFKIDLGDPAICPDRCVRTFDYRAYLKGCNLVARPHDSHENPLAALWHEFRSQRDDLVWKWLVDQIRTHAAARGRRVLVSANGLARYVDLQVLGVWDEWRTKDGKIDLSESQIDTWGSIVAAGWGMAGKHVPVVFFHDWGFGGFPWMQVSPDERTLWMRVRGPEIYAAGGFFAFPVHGPFGNDALKDGTIGEVARQTAFYQAHRGLYQPPNARLLGFEPLETPETLLSLALWQRGYPPALVLHAINRQAKSGEPVRRRDVAVTIPVAELPKQVAIVSPDWSGERPGRARLDAGKLTVVIPELDAYAVAVLPCDKLPEIRLAGRRIAPPCLWSRPAKSEFVVEPGGTVRGQWALNGYLQGRLHGHLRNPPTFLVHMPEGGTLRVHVRGVAMLGARLEYSVDGRVVKTVELPDRDGKNEARAAEYGQTYEFPIPPGRRRLTLENTGGDWACIGWYAFVGRIEE